MYTGVGDIPLIIDDSVSDSEIIFKNSDGSSARTFHVVQLTPAFLQDAGSRLQLEADMSGMHIAANSVKREEYKKIQEAQIKEVIKLLTENKMTIPELCAKYGGLTTYVINEASRRITLGASDE